MTTDDHADESARLVDAALEELQWPEPGAWRAVNRTERDSEPEEPRPWDHTRPPPRNLFKDLTIT